MIVPDNFDSIQTLSQDEAVKQTYDISSDSVWCFVEDLQCMIRRPFSSFDSWDKGIVMIDTFPSLGTDYQYAGGIRYAYWGNFVFRALCVKSMKNEDTAADAYNRAMSVVKR